MEALATISLASNVLQCVDHAVQYTKLVHKLASSHGDAVSRHKDVVASTERMAQGIECVNQFNMSAAIKGLADQCCAVVVKVQTIVNELPKKQEDNLIRSFHKTGKTLYRQKELRELSDSLSDLHAQVSHHLLVLIRSQQVSIERKLDTLVSPQNPDRCEIRAALQKSVTLLLRASQKIHDKHKSANTTSHKSQSSSRLELVVREYIALCKQSMEEGIHRKKELLLQGLHYDQLREREFAIADAHKKTFHWVFGANTSFKFHEWLREHNGIYWITGKAGSGKSTLMKFLVDECTKRTPLREWAAGDDLVIAKHFFWSSGTAIQKSQEGLFRALLFQIFKQRPQIIEEVCAERFNGPFAQSFSSWSRPQLLQALDNIGAMKQPGFKVCVFIDGLDECHGDHTELVNIIHRIASHPHLKICTSSRTFLGFMDASDSPPWNLYVHDLTLKDMYSFVNDTLCEDYRFKKLQSNHRSAAADLILDITKRAKGVFLWTFLVTRFLLREFHDEDNIQDLRHRVQLLPTDLSEYFGRMLASIEDVYRTRVSRLLLTMSLARTTLPIIAFLCLNFEDEPMADEPLAFLHNWPNMDMDEAHTLTTKTRQLVHQCKDLINISSEPEEPLLFGEKVRFLHRTVVDYLQTDEANRRLVYLAGRSFEPRMVLLQANLAQLRSLLHLHSLTYIRSRLAQWILGSLYYAYEFEVTTGNTMVQELDNLERIIDQHFNRWGFSHAMDILFREPDITSFIQLACVCDLALYVGKKVSELTPAKLGSLAPKWQSPTRITQSSGFEIANLGHGEEKRLSRLLEDLRTTDQTGKVQGPGDNKSPTSPTSVAKTVSFNTTQQEEVRAPPNRKEGFRRRVRSVFRGHSVF